MYEQSYFNSVESTKNNRNILLFFVEFAIMRYDKFICAFLRNQAQYHRNNDLQQYKGCEMNVGIIAHNSKKTLIEDFCIAYKGILSRHDIYATGTTGRRIEDVTNLHVHKFLPGSIGGDKQFTEMIERNAMDMVIFFYNPNMIDPKDPDVNTVVTACDRNNIPVATNIATAELLVLGLGRGDLDWRLSMKSSDEL